MLSAHLNRLTLLNAPKDGWRCLSAYCWQFVWLANKQGNSRAANDLEGGNNRCVCSSVCLRMCAVRRVCGAVAPPYVCTGGYMWIHCMCSAAYYMDLTSSPVWSLLLGINHGDLWHANPFEVIHRAVLTTFRYTVGLACQKCPFIQLISQHHLQGCIMYST